MGGRTYYFDGMRFGRLTVKNYVGNSVWECECDCGGSTKASSYALKTGKVLSCGCYGSERRSEVKKDRTGMRYGRLTVVKRVRKRLWLCKCDCGNEVVVDGGNLTTGHTKSCGCLRDDTSKINNTTHGYSKERLYEVWTSIKKRCYNKHNAAYRDYGGRGIGMCQEWRSNYVAFREWALSSGYDSTAPKGQCTIDRIGNDGNYCPENCRWVDMHVQRVNQRPRKLHMPTLFDVEGIGGQCA